MGMRIQRHWQWIVLGSLAVVARMSAAQGQPTAGEIAAAVREYRTANEAAIIKDLVDLLAIPNIASDEPDIRRNAERLRSMVERSSP
jgi:hypothetical protein